MLLQNNKKSWSFFRSPISMVISCISLIAIGFIIISPKSEADVSAINTSVAMQYRPFNAANYYISISKESENGVNIDASTSKDGDYSIGSDQIISSSNLPNGYNIYIGMATGTPSNSLFLNGDSASDTIVPTSGQTISDNTIIPASLSTNSWGYAVADPSLGFSSDYSKNDAEKLWMPVGTNGSETLIYASDNSTTNKVTTVYYGTNLNDELSAGEYTNTVTYSILGENTTDDILVSPSNINANTTTELQIITTLFTSMTIDPGELTVTLVDSSSETVYTCANPSASSEVDGYSGVIVITCTTPNLPEGNYIVSVDIPKYSYSQENDILNVINPSAAPTTLEDGLYMQDVTPSMCSNTPSYSEENTTYTLFDKRDNEPYGVRKLADGNCYMTDNLRLTSDTLTANSHSTTLDDSDTDLDGITASDKSLTGGTFTLPNSATWTDTSQTGNHAVPAANAPLERTTANPVDGVSELSGGGLVNTAYAYGTYYTWCTATANCSRQASAGESMTTSICPKGWKLPSQGTDNNVTHSRQYLYSTKYSSNSVNLLNDFYGNSYSSYYIVNGYMRGSNFKAWWSSTKYSSTTAYDLWSTGNDIDIEDNTSTYQGMTIRCALWSN